MFEKIIWAILIIVNLLGAFFYATKGDIGFELINLFSLYISWKEYKDV